MKLTETNAFVKIKDLVASNVQKMVRINKPQFKFLLSIIELWLCLPVRYTMMNLSRFGKYCDKSIRLRFSQRFNFAEFNDLVIGTCCGKEQIAVLDPSYISKSGKKTYGLGKYWSGKDQCSKKGLEVSCLSIIDVESETAMSLEVVQTPDKQSLKKSNFNLIDQYVSVVKNQIKIIKNRTKYLVVDGYFMKHKFINSMLQSGLEVITKMRRDANLCYLPTGKQNNGRGRPKLHGCKVDCKNLNISDIQKFNEDEESSYYSGLLYSVALKRIVRIVYIQCRKSKRYEILLSTDVNLAPEKILVYYRLRFQVEFLIRDAKQYTGFEQCQARSKEKLHFHFNMAFTVVSIAKAATWISIPKEQRGPFSMRNIKLLYYNKYLTDRIFQNLGLNLNCNKLNSIYQQCIDVGHLAA